MTSPIVGVFLDTHHSQFFCHTLDYTHMIKTTNKQNQKQIKKEGSQNIVTIE